MFSVNAQTAYLSERLSNHIMMLEEHWKNEILFQNVYGHKESVNLRIRGMFITLFFFYFFVLWVPLQCYSAGTIMEFKLLIRDI